MNEFNPLRNINNVPQSTGMESMHKSSEETLKAAKEDKEQTLKNEEALKKSGMLGKSQVSKPDNLNADLKICKPGNEKMLQNCEAFFNSVFEELQKKNKKNAYEEACFLTKEFEKEFSKKGTMNDAGKTDIR